MENYKGVNILFEDNHLLAVSKPQNIPTQADESKDTDLQNLMKSYLIEKYNKPGDAYLGIVHRLDRPTGGVIVFAKTSKAAERLSEAIKKGDFEKKYLAVTKGIPKVKKQILTNYLLKNTDTNTVHIVPRLTEGAKEARLAYNLLESSGDCSLLDIDLYTGRSHQIRVQLAGQGLPLLGDIKYGGDKVKGTNLALWAYKLSFEHPVTKSKMVFISYPPETEPWKKFNIEKYLLIKFSNDD